MLFVQFSYIVSGFCDSRHSVRVRINGWIYGAVIKKNVDKLRPKHRLRLAACLHTILSVGGCSWYFCKKKPKKDTAGKTHSACSANAKMKLRQSDLDKFWRHSKLRLLASTVLHCCGRYHKEKAQTLESAQLICLTRTAETTR